MNRIAGTTTVEGEIVIDVTPENEDLRFKRGATYTVEYSGKRYCGMKGFRTSRRGRRLIVFRPGPKTTGPTNDGEKSRLLYRPEHL